MPFSYMLPEQYRHVVISALFSFAKTRKAFSDPQEVIGDEQSDGQASR